MNEFETEALELLGRIAVATESLLKIETAKLPEGQMIDRLLRDLHLEPTVKVRPLRRSREDRRP